MEVVIQPTQAFENCSHSDWWIGGFNRPFVHQTDMFWKAVPVLLHGHITRLVSGQHALLPMYHWYICFPTKYKIKETFRNNSEQSDIYILTCKDNITVTTIFKLKPAYFQIFHLISSNYINIRHAVIYIWTP